MSDPKRIPYCASCGSSEVHKDASAQWDEVFQEWTLVTTFDCATCQDCGEECDLEWRAQPANEQEFQAIIESVVKERDELLAVLKPLAALAGQAHSTMTDREMTALWRAHNAANTVIAKAEKAKGPS